MATTADVRDFRRLAAKSRTAPPAIRRRTGRALTEAARPVRREIAASARSKLPRRGGLGAWVAAARVTVRQVDQGGTVGVAISASKAGHDLAAIDAGSIRHPTWGRAPLHQQGVTPGYFTDVMTGPVARRARKAMLDALAAAMREAGTI